MADQANFLPEYGSPKTRTKDGKRLNCLVRHKEVQATPEESVRQRVLHWLIHDKGWEAGKLRLEHAYKWESDLGRSHVRPDIELLDDEDNVLVVVECKREDVPLDEGVDAQAIGYAIKSYAPYIWVTNGGEHKFLKRDRSGAWDQVPSIEPLGETYEPPTGRIPFPSCPMKMTLRDIWRSTAWVPSSIATRSASPWPFTMRCSKPRQASHFRTPTTASIYLSTPESLFTTSHFRVGVTIGGTRTSLLRHVAAWKRCPSRSILGIGVASVCVSA